MRTPTTSATLPECRTAAVQRGLFYRAAKAWNSLNNNARTAQSLRSFLKKVCKGSNEEIAYRRLNIQLQCIITLLVISSSSNFKSLFLFQENVCHLSLNQ